MTNNKKILIATIIAVVLASVGIAFAAFTYLKAGTTNSKLIAGDVYMRYSEGSSGISISNLMPSASYPTKASGNYFQFQIIGKNTNTTKNVSFQVKVSKGALPSGKTESNRIGDSYLRFKLVEVTNPGQSGETETAVATDKYFSTISNSLVYTGSIPKNTTSDVTKTYRLYVRVVESVTIGTNANYTISTWNNLFASVKVNVTGSLA